MFRSIITALITTGLILTPVAESVAAKKDKKVQVKKNKKHKKSAGSRAR